MAATTNILIAVNYTFCLKIECFQRIIFIMTFFRNKNYTAYFSIVNKNKIPKTTSALKQSF